MKDCKSNEMNTGRSPSGIATDFFSLEEQFEPLKRDGLDCETPSKFSNAHSCDKPFPLPIRRVSERFQSLSLLDSLLKDLSLGPFNFGTVESGHNPPLFPPHQLSQHMGFDSLGSLGSLLSSFDRFKPATECDQPLHFPQHVRSFSDQGIPEDISRAADAMTQHMNHLGTLAEVKTEKDSRFEQYTSLTTEFPALKDKPLFLPVRQVSQTIGDIPKEISSTTAEPAIPARSSMAKDLRSDSLESPPS